MPDKRTRQSIEFLNWWLKECGPPRDDTTAQRRLEKAIDDYLEWMPEQGYRPGTIEDYRRTLNKFVVFTKGRGLSWDEMFTMDTLKWFQKVRALTWAPGVRGLSRYLFEQGKIPRSIAKRKAPVELPENYEQYLAYHKQSQQASDTKIIAIRRVLAAFYDHLEKNRIKLCHLKIEHVDAFLAEFGAGFSQNTKKTYRGYLRGFLNYLYHERLIIKADLAPLVVGRRLYAQAKPPQFLRSHEVERLFASLKVSTATDIRTYAMVHLTYCLGLRPVEVSKISLDNLSFSRTELTLRTRKSNNPMTLPVPEHTIKAVAAYLIGGRPDSKCRAVFLSFYPPYRPLSPGVIGRYVTECMRRAGLCATAYWLRHTYAQNLLEAGASVYEIKEMLGHDRIESSKSYLHIHTKLMREVLFDETL
ncbi:MAG: tyrosine-type recombinase/integrase [Deltaproteobacteria bacterium]|nr:tyrosine-type recombinase/integrase [Deltaproteobacteria bacterium]